MRIMTLVNAYIYSFQISSESDRPIKMMTDIWVLNHGINNFENQACSLLHLIYYLPTESFSADSYIQPSRSAVLDISNDSGEEGEPDPAITPPFHRLTIKWAVDDAIRTEEVSERDETGRSV